MFVCTSGSINQRKSVDDLAAIAKGLKKKNGRKGGKRAKSWVEKQGKEKQCKEAAVAILGVAFLMF